MSYLDDAVAAIEQNEGTYPWMYLDTRGYVTVATGKMLSGCEAACALPFRLEGALATSAQVAEEFARVKAMESGMRASAYHCADSLTLDLADMSDITRSIVVADDAFLAVTYPRYADFPDGVKVALHDMCFNLGRGGLSHYPTMNRALNATPPDFLTAAAQCRRNGPSDERNDWTKALFTAAATSEETT